MSNEIRVHSTWYSNDDDENYSVTNIYVNENQDTVVCAHSLDTGSYDEWYLHDFYREFTFVSEESL